MNGSYRDVDFIYLCLLNSQVGFIFRKQVSNLKFDTDKDGETIQRVLSEKTLSAPFFVRSLYLALLKLLAFNRRIFYLSEHLFA